MAEHKTFPRIVLVVIALGATFAVGLLAGREMVRPRPTPQDALGPEAVSPPPAVAPELLAYRLLVKIPLDLARPRGIAGEPDGTIWACGDRALVRVDRAGAVKMRIAMDGEPRCVTRGPRGTLFVGVGGQVELVDPAAGKAEVWADLGSEAIVTSVAFGSSGVYVADAGASMVLRFDEGGKLLGRLDKGFAVPSPYFDVAVAADGSLWAANPGGHCVRHYTANGTLLSSWGTASTTMEGFAGCCNPAAIALLPCGALVTGEKGFVRVKVYEADGALTYVVGLPRDFPVSDKGIDIATRKGNGGEIIVLVPAERAVRVYAKKGAEADE